MKRGVIAFAVIILALTLMNIVSAGVGIKWSAESFKVYENEKTCLSYSVYNPWPNNSSVQITLPENLISVMVSEEAEIKLIPANTASANAIPVEVCFKVPRVYAQDCLGWGMICKQECTEEQKVYEGSISVKSVPDPVAGGSSAQAAVSAPLRLKVMCTPHGRDFSIVYIALASISAIGIFIILFRKYRKPEKERKREELVRLREEMKRLKGKK
ncbi:MAG: hypothetical protein WCP89_04085 [archaeon]